jgi:REP-associated tyrosine transposase
MVLAYHAIITTYGFWLPNDPRGSWSDFVRAWELFWYGGATKVDATRSVARAPHNRALRELQKTALLYEEVCFDGKQAQCVGLGFKSRIFKSGYQILACSILQQHVHLVLARHRFHVEFMINQLKGAATRALSDAGLHPLQNYRNKHGAIPSPWTVGLWKVFLDSPEAIRRAIKYVEENPLREGKPKQRWSFVMPYAI